VSRHRGHRHGQAAPAATTPAATTPAATTQLPPASAALSAPPSPPSLPPAPQPPSAPPSIAASDPFVQHGAVSTLAPITMPPPVAPRPTPTLVPTGRGQRKAAKRDARRKQLRRGSVVGGVVVAVVALVAGVVLTTGGAAKRKVVAATPDGRTQHTMLLTLAPAGGAAVESVLMAHDSASAQGAFVLIPSDILTEVAGRGSMQLGAAATFGVDVPGETLSDMISVTVDGSWQLTPDALAALVDHLGGITVDVPVDISVNGQVVVSAGNGQRLTGAQASAMATFIAADEPSGARLARFETVLVAIMAKLGTQPSAVSAELASLTTGSTFDAHRTMTIQVLADVDADANAQNVTYTTLPTTVLDTGSTQEQLAVDGTGTAALVKQSFAGSIPPGRVAGRNRVIVLNGTGQLGLGASARQRLTAHGLVFVRSANQDGFGYKNKTSVVLIPDATPDSLASGDRVAEALGLPTSDVETYTVDTTAADVIAILGDDYKP
jgi:anionic cell wall polymer biosynthesis LytR-Cps2A-Psr (LCP) family protein